MRGHGTMRFSQGHWAPPASRAAPWDARGGACCAPRARSLSPGVTACAHAWHRFIYGNCIMIAGTKAAAGLPAARPAATALCPAAWGQGRVHALSKTRYSRTKSYLVFWFCLQLPQHAESLWARHPKLVLAVEKENLCLKQQTGRLKHERAVVVRAGRCNSRWLAEPIQFCLAGFGRWQAKAVQLPNAHHSLVAFTCTAVPPLGEVESPCAAPAFGLRPAPFLQHGQAGPTASSRGAVRTVRL